MFELFYGTVVAAGLQVGWISLVSVPEANIRACVSAVENLSLDPDYASLRARSWWAGIGAAADQPGELKQACAWIMHRYTACTLCAMKRPNQREETTSLNTRDEPLDVVGWTWCSTQQSMLRGAGSTTSQVSPRHTAPSLPSSVFHVNGIQQGNAQAGVSAATSHCTCTMAHCTLVDFSGGRPSAMPGSTP